MYHCQKVLKDSTASNASGSRWLLSLEKEMESSMAPGDNQKLKIDRSNWKCRKCCIYMATSSLYISVPIQVCFSRVIATTIQFGISWSILLIELSIVLLWWVQLGCLWWSLIWYNIIITFFSSKTTNIKPNYNGMDNTFLDYPQKLNRLFLQHQ